MSPVHIRMSEIPIVGHWKVCFVFALYMTVCYSFFFLETWMWCFWFTSQYRCPHILTPSMEIQLCPFRLSDVLQKWINSPSCPQLLTKTLHPQKRPVRVEEYKNAMKKTSLQPLPGHVQVIVRKRKWGFFPLSSKDIEGIYFCGWSTQESTVEVTHDVNVAAHC